jgi:hypothetical protein
VQNFREIIANLQTRRRIIYVAGTAALVVLVSLVAVVVVFLATRGADDAPPPVVRESSPFVAPTPPPPPVVEDDYEDEYEAGEVEYEYAEPEITALLTGLPIDEEYLHRRPIAVVVNNIRAALPQSGLLYADIVYEVLTEGDVTRLVAVFQSQMPSERVGPIRSTRMYFAGFALNHDAAFVHHGCNTWAQPDLARIHRYLDVRMDGMALEGRVFWRDRSFPAWTGQAGQRAQEHSSYTSWERISDHMAASDMRDYMREDFEEGGFGFAFGDVPEGIAHAYEATSIHVPFSRNYARFFEYVAADNSYLVARRQGPTLDAETQEQLTVDNILIQFTAQRIWCNTWLYRDVDTVGSGMGYLLRDGLVFPVTWEKAAQDAPTRWAFTCGTPVMLSPGSTWIAVLQNTVTPIFE